ncbi:hypothetical protein L6164_024990 [Bauhinia variegata]|uniref:Uncharacterized protein n=1 Tax=Bauhinia variegata TaxID=167791 RepID=A0ACB9M0K0_BAUVA|nr:hypothetical protein L6164_024990 [Bauhinia variegata]
MDSNDATTLVLCPPSPSPCPSKPKKEHQHTSDYHEFNEASEFLESNLLQKQPKQQLAKQFLWPSGDLVHSNEQQELKEPLIDMDGFFRGDAVATAGAAQLLREACMKHGCFQITNHGVDLDLIRAAHDEVDTIFNLPLTKKLSARRIPDNLSGYSGAHSHRFSSKLPWKETFSFRYKFNSNLHLHVVDYFKSVLGEDFEHTGSAYQRYCEAMKELTLMIMELLAISLGVDRMHYRKFFQDGRSPSTRSLGCKLGDTFMALSNGRYKSCLHRALVNKEKKRRSMAFFVSPREDKIVRPPEDLFGRQEPRKYPDFTWSDLLEFTEKHYRSDVETLKSFIHWFTSNSNPNC